MKVAQSVLELIGETPLVRINRLNPNPKVAIYAKLEGQNPGGSVKDRIAVSMIEAAEESGELTRDKTILEPTSGNTGIGLAMIAAVKGYKTVLVMSEGMSDERKKLLKAFGAELVLTDASQGTDGAIREACRMLRMNPEKYWMPNQFDNPNNPLAHRKTAKEIMQQLPETTMFVGSMGTSGTLMGIANELRRQSTQIKIIGAEPEENHSIQGLKNMNEAIVPKIYDEKKLHEKIVVKTEDAYKTARNLVKMEGLFVGMSSGAAMWAAIEQVKKMEEGNIVVLFPDRGEKYLSTGLFTE